MDRESAPGAIPHETTNEQADYVLAWLGIAVDDSAAPVETVSDATPLAEPAAVVYQVTAQEPPSPVATKQEPRAAVPRWARSRALRGVLVAAAVVGLVFGVYAMGSKSEVPGVSGPTTDAATSTAKAVDPAKVTALMQKLATNQKDTATLLALGDLYFQAGDFKTAAGWEQKVLAIDSRNVTALLALGAADFNLGDAKAAEVPWLKVVSINPRMAEAHYDLGFLYLSQTPPDMGKVRAEWTKVVQIDPTSEVAKSVKAHLDSLNKSAANATPAPAGK